MRCLIVAAGQGVRLQEKLELKPLVPLGRRPLIEHVIARARRAGIDHFVVVSGYRGDELRSSLDALAERDGIGMSHVVNDEWTRSNGVSVLKAMPQLHEPFVMTMCDHLVDPDIIRNLMAGTRSTDGVTLAVDSNLDNALVDPEDVTRVKSSEGRIERIGKLIPDFDCFDTGVFHCHPIIFDALRESQSSGDDSISGAMNVLARWGKAYVLDIGDRLWIDVDDLAMLRRAEELLRSGRL